MRSAIIIGKGFHAFIDGIKQNHICDSHGDILYVTASGKRITWNTHKKWASLTTMARRPLLYEYYAGLGDQICCESSSCSICKEASVDAAYWI